MTVTQSLSLREKHVIMVFENRILRRIFRFKRDEDGKGKRLHNEELLSLFRLPIIVRFIKCRR
jgi:hypothetical protein